MFSLIQFLRSPLAIKRTSLRSGIVSDFDPDEVAAMNLFVHLTLLLTALEIVHANGMINSYFLS